MNDFDEFSKQHPGASAEPKKIRNVASVCGNCPYWDKEERDEDEELTFGQCRAKPPEIRCDEAVWPRTCEVDWCKKHPDFYATGHQSICVYCGELVNDSVYGEKTRIAEFKGKPMLVHTICCVKDAERTKTTKETP